jgi:hypothetical protein
MRKATAWMNPAEIEKKNMKEFLKKKVRQYALYLAKQSFEIDQKNSLLEYYEIYITRFRDDWKKSTSEERRNFISKFWKKYD